MSVLQYPDDGNKDVHVWNNAAFDSYTNRQDSIEKNPIFIINPLDSFESFSSKENHDPNGGVLASSKVNFKRDDKSSESEVREEKEIDKEIEEIEMEMKRLASRLEALRIKKAQKIGKNHQKRGKIIPGKFMDMKDNPQEKKKMEESLSKSSKLSRRGLSLGPVEIASCSRRRGLSLGPSEIVSVSAMKSKQLGKQQDFSTTPVQPVQNRRKSCFWKLEDIDEGKVTTKGKGKQLPFMRQAVTTIGLKKYVKKDDEVLTSVQPKKLFGNGEKSLLSTASKKPVRQGRVVASRYNQISGIRKMSLPDNENVESKRCEKKRSLSAEKNIGEENKNVDIQKRIKKRWEIPSEIVIHGSNYDDEKSPQSVSVMHDLLPKLRVGRLPKESPRDSGPAKKVVELIGRKSFFTSDEEMEQPVCQSLSFAEEDDEMSIEEEEMEACVHQL